MTDYGQKIAERSRPVSFERTMGLLSATTLGVGSLMGAGLYVLVGIAAAEAGPGLWIAYAVCGGLTLFSALMYGELSKRLPISGGGYLYAYNRLGSFWGFLVGWHLAVGSIFACALYAYGFGSYLTPFIPWGGDTGFFIRLVAILLVLVLAGLSLRGGGDGARLQGIFTWGNVAVVTALIVIGLMGFDPHRFTPMLPRGGAGVGGAISLVYISFFGYQLIANTSEEVRDPKRNVPLAMVFSLAIAFLFYLLVAIVSVGAVPWEELAASDAPLVLVAERGIGGGGTVLIGVGALLASVAALNGTLVSQARQIFAMGRDRILPERLGTVSKGSGTPATALLAGAGVTVVVLLFADLSFVAKAANFSLLFSMLPLSMALHGLYKEQVAAGESISLIKRVIPFAALLANTGLLLTLDFESLMFGGTIVGVACIVFFTYSYSSEKRGQAGFSVNLSDDAASAFRFGGEKILVPMANPDTQERLFQLAESLSLAHEAEIVVLSVVLAKEGQNPRDVFSRQSQMGDAVQVLNGAALAAKKEGVEFIPVVRAAKSLDEGIVHAAEEERPKLIVMGWSAAGDGAPSELVKRVAGATRANLAFLHLKPTTGETGGRFRRIGVALGGGSNGALMGQLANAMADQRSGVIDYFSVLPMYYEKPELDRVRHIHVSAIGRHDSLVPYRTEILQSDNPFEAIVKRTRELDLLIVGVGDPGAVLTDNVGAFASMVARQSHCSVILVRQEKKLPSFIPPVRGRSAEPVRG